MTKALQPHTLEGRIVKLPPLEGKVVLHVVRCGPCNQELPGAWGAVLFAGSIELLCGSGILESKQRTLEGAVRAADAWYARQRLIGWPPLTTISICGSTKQILASTLSAPLRRSGSETTEARRASQVAVDTLCNRRAGSSPESPSKYTVPSSEAGRPPEQEAPESLKIFVAYSGCRTRNKHAWGAFIENESACIMTASGPLDRGGEISAVQAVREWLSRVLPDRNYLLFDDAQGTHQTRPEGDSSVQGLPRKSKRRGGRAHEVATAMLETLCDSAPPPCEPYPSAGQFELTRKAPQAPSTMSQGSSPERMYRATGLQETRPEGRRMDGARGSLNAIPRDEVPNVTKQPEPPELERESLKLPPENLQGELVLHVARCKSVTQAHPGSWGAVLFSDSKELLCGYGILKPRQRNLAQALREADTWYALQRLNGWPPLSALCVCGKSAKKSRSTFSAPLIQTGNGSKKAQRANEVAHDTLLHARAVSSPESPCKQATPSPGAQRLPGQETSRSLKVYVDYSGSHTRKEHAWGAFIEDGNAPSITTSGKLSSGGEASAVRAAEEWLSRVLPNRTYILFNDGQGQHPKTAEGITRVQWLPRHSAGIKRAHKAAKSMLKSLL